MATMLEDYTTEEQRSLVRVLWTKGLIANDMHKEMIPVYGGRCDFYPFGPLKITFLANVSLMAKRLKTEVRKWLRQQSKEFYAAGFDALVKRLHKCISVGGGYVEQ
jgi:hypothetical protein